MKIKIVSIEPDYASFPSISIAAKAGVIVNIKSIVEYEILEVEGANAPIKGKLYTVSTEATKVLQEVKENALIKIDQFKCFHLPGKTFELGLMKNLVNKEFELGDNR